MVQQGPFLVELVRADTRQSFAEHTSEDGKQRYAEVEPEVEYFIKVSHTHVVRKIIRADFWVDGEKLKYCTNLIRGQEEIHGLWSLQGDRQINKALRFKVLESRHASPDKQDGFDPWIGSVKVTFSEAIPSGVRRTRNFKSHWEGASVDGSISENVRKVVQSKEGELALVTKNPRKKQRFNAGNRLASVKIQYCTAFGLIQAGLLPKPPVWDFHRAQYPRELFSPSKRTPSMTRCLNVTPKTKVMTPADPTKGIEEVRVEEFDLVEADHSDSEENAADGKQPSMQAAQDIPEENESKQANTSDDEPAPQKVKRKLIFSDGPSKRHTRSSGIRS